MVNIAELWFLQRLFLPRVFWTLSWNTFLHIVQGLYAFRSGLGRYLGWAFVLRPRLRNTVARGSPVPRLQGLVLLLATLGLVLDVFVVVWDSFSLHCGIGFPFIYFWASTESNCFRVLKSIQAPVSCNLTLADTGHVRHKHSFFADRELPFKVSRWLANLQALVLCVFEMVLFLVCHRIPSFRTERLILVQLRVGINLVSVIR